MIICHTHRILFSRPRKVASTSFEIALSKFCSAQDVLTPLSLEEDRQRVAAGYHGPQNYKKSISDILHDRSVTDLAEIKNFRMPRRFYGHMPLSEIKSAVSPNVWAQYLKVSMVRNPWDRIMSNYFFWKRTFKRNPPFDVLGYSFQDDE